MQQASAPVDMPFSLVQRTVLEPYPHLEALGSDGAFGLVPAHHRAEMRRCAEVVRASVSESPDWVRNNLSGYTGFEQLPEEVQQGVKDKVRENAAWETRCGRLVLPRQEYPAVLDERFPKDASPDDQKKFKENWIAVYTKAFAENSRKRQAALNVYARRGVYHTTVYESPASDRSDLANSMRDD